MINYSTIASGLGQFEEVKDITWPALSYDKRLKMAGIHVTSVTVQLWMVTANLNHA